MAYIEYIKATGAIIKTINTNSEITPWETEEKAFIKIDGLVDEEKVYYKDGQLLEYPEKPGKFYNWDGSSWVEDVNSLTVSVKHTRDLMLQESDWTDLVSASGRLGNAKHKAWQDYRQALRDITAQPDYPTNITWPTKPL
jgi:hypothetical protein